MKKILFMATMIVISTVKMSFAQSKTDVAFNQVLTSYYDLKNALASDKQNVAIENAKTLINKVDAVPHMDLPENQHQFWMEQASLIKAKSTELIGATTIALQRKAFEGISNPMIKTLQTIKFNANTAFVQYCPMAKASWLNEKESIENPYYGKMMFKCGKVSETLMGK